jgi:hypothetical protein
MTTTTPKIGLTFSQIAANIANSSNNSDNTSHSTRTLVSNNKEATNDETTTTTTTTADNESTETTSDQYAKSNLTEEEKENGFENAITDFIEIDYNDLEFFEVIDSGRFGSVYRCLWKSHNKEVAVKKVLGKCDNEASILNTCSHRNIIKFYGLVTNLKDYCIVTGNFIFY